MNRLKINTLYFVLYLLPSLVFSACSGGEGGSAGSPAPGGAPVTVGEPPSAKVVLFLNRSEVTPGEDFTLKIKVQDVEKVFFILFDLSYDPEIVAYDEAKAEEGTFLNRGNTELTSFQAALENDVQGKITIGLTRLGQIGGVSGNGTLMTLHFQAIKPGTTTLGFIDPKGLKNSAQEDVTINAWENATVTVQ